MEIRRIRRLRVHLAPPPFFYPSVALAAGIWLAGLTTISFPAAAFCAFVLLLAAGVRIGKLSFLLVNFILFLCLGILFGINANAAFDRHIALMVPEGRLVLEGVVRSVPERVVTGRRVTDSFILAAKNFYRRGQTCETEGEVQAFLHNTGREIHFGDRLRLAGTLEYPKGKRNPHSFDYGEYLRAQGVHRVFRGIGHYAVLKQTTGEGDFLVTEVNRLRTHLRERIQALLKPPLSELASGLVLGFRKGIPYSIRDDFILSGTAHLLAISGLNLSMLGGMVFMACAFLGVPRIPRLLSAIIFILVYTAVAGAQPPVLRAGVMGTVVLAGLVLGREKDERNAFFFALSALLVWDPKLLFQVSFQLSFAALAALLFILPRLSGSVFRPAPGDFEKKRNERKRLNKGLDSRLEHFWRGMERGFRETFLASLAVTLGLFPILIYYFHVFSVIGFVANLVVVPLGTAVITAVLFLLIADWAVPFAASSFAAGPRILLDLLVNLVHFFGSLPFGCVPLPLISAPVVGIYYLLLTAWLLTAKRPISKWIPRTLLACLAILVLFCFFLSPLSGPRVIFFDLGRSSSVFVRFSNRANCLINAGRKFPSDQVYWILRPFFMAEGVRKIDSVILTKLDASRAGALATLLNYYHPQRLMTAEPFKSGEKWGRYAGGVRNGKTDYETLKSGDLIRFGSSRGEFIKILAADKDEILAFKINDGSESILCITSSRRGETLNLLADIEDLKADVLYLPHWDGTFEPAAKRLIKLVGPRVIISNQRGETGDFQRALEKLTSAEIFWIADSGAVELIKQDDAWRIKPLLDSHPDRASRTVFTP